MRIVYNYYVSINIVGFLIQKIMIFILEIRLSLISKINIEYVKIKMLCIFILAYENSL